MLKLSTAGGPGPGAILEEPDYRNMVTCLEATKVAKANELALFAQKANVTFDHTGSFVFIQLTQVSLTMGLLFTPNTQNALLCISLKLASNIH